MNLSRIISIGVLLAVFHVSAFADTVVFSEVDASKTLVDVFSVIDRAAVQVMVRRISNTTAVPAQYEIKVTAGVGARSTYCKVPATVTGLMKVQQFLYAGTKAISTYVNSAKEISLEGMAAATGGQNCQANPS